MSQGIQSNYDEVQPALHIGTLASTLHSTFINKRNIGAAPAMPGDVATLVAGDDDGAQVGVAGGFAGIVMDERVLDTGNTATDGVQPNCIMVLVRKGDIVVRVVNAVQANEAATFDPAANTIGAGLASSFDNGWFRHNAPAGGLVRLILE